MISKDNVLAVAKLVRLDLTDDQITKFAGQLSGVLKLFEEVKDIDVSSVTETSQVTGLKNITREDAVACEADLRPCDASELLTNVPLKEGTKIVVPKIISR